MQKLELFFSQNGSNCLCDWESLWRAERTRRQAADGGRAESVSDERADKSLLTAGMLRQQGALSTHTLSLVIQWQETLNSVCVHKGTFMCPGQGKHPGFVMLQWVCEGSHLSRSSWGRASWIRAPLIRGETSSPSLKRSPVALIQLALRHQMTSLHVWEWVECWNQIRIGQLRHPPPLLLRHKGHKLSRSNGV